MYIYPTPSRCYDFLPANTVPAGITCSDKRVFYLLSLTLLKNMKKTILGTRPDPTTIILCLRPKTDYSVFNVHFLCSKYLLCYPHLPLI